MAAQLIPAAGGLTPVPRRVTGLFWAVLALVVAQMGWWVVFHIRFSRAESRRQIAAWQASVPVAARAVAHQARLAGSSPPPQLPAHVLERDFPHLAWAPAAVAADPEQAALYPGWAPVVRPQGPARLLGRDRQHMRMFLFEGSFFLAMLAVGAAAVRRALGQEAGLVLRQANFLSAVTHELKSPLASIRLFTETLQLRDPPPPTRGQYLGTILQEAGRLEALVGNLLAAAHLDVDGATVSIEHADLGQLVAGWVADFQAEVGVDRLPVALALPATPVWARVDVGGLRLALRNLLDNAVKYGRLDQHPAEVAVSAQRGAARLEVRDHGVGIAAGEAARVFDKFYRAGDELVRSSAGSGLGLYLTRALVEAQGGQVSVDSAGPDAGATFRLTLPLAPPAQAAS